MAIETEAPGVIVIVAPPARPPMTGWGWGEDGDDDDNHVSEWMRLMHLQ